MAKRGLCHPGAALLAAATRARDGAPGGVLPTLQDKAGSAAAAPAPAAQRGEKTSFAGTVVALLALQLGFGLWLMPAAYSRLGWVPGTAVILLLMVLTMYSGRVIARLVEAVGDCVLFCDIGEAAAGRKGRILIQTVVNSFGATRCIILHLVAAESLQHVAGDAAPPLVVHSLVVALIALAAVQVKSLARLGWFLTLGTCGQVFALVVVVVELLTGPLHERSTQSFQLGDMEVALVGIMNVVFAYGGQFAFVEVVNSMQQPERFPAAVRASTLIMGAAYVGLGAIGYWALGSSVPSVIIFGLSDGLFARLACNAILAQAVGQYLLNLNVWTHNLLTLLARAQSSQGGAAIESAADHHWLVWLAGTSLVITYSFAVSMTVPFLSSLVALATSATSLLCAYTLPCAFTLALLPERVGRGERALCALLIPASLLMSGTGFYSSLRVLAGEVTGAALLRDRGLAEVAEPG